MYKVIDKNTNTYLRYDSKESILLKDKLKKIYNNNIIISNSGLNATSISINTIINLYKNTNINIIYPKELYFENINLIQYYNKYYNCNLISFDINNDDSIIDIIKKVYLDNNIIIIESCINHFGYIFNFDLIKIIKNISKYIYIICDNTWLSNIIFNPINLNIDIDIITISLTKHYSGNNCILGAIIIKDIDIYNTCNDYCIINGIHNSPLNVNIINNYIYFMKDRLINSSKLCKFALQYLNKYNIICIHPYLHNHISNHICIKYFNQNIYPSTFLLETLKTKNELLYIINKLKLIIVSISFGSNETRIDKNIFSKNNKFYLRLSIGYDDIFNNLLLKLNELIYYLK